MSGKNINFNDKKIKKSINVNSILVSKKEPYGNKN